MIVEELKVVQLLRNSEVSFLNALDGLFKYCAAILVG